MAAHFEFASQNLQNAVSGAWANSTEWAKQRTGNGAPDVADEDSVEATSETALVGCASSASAESLIFASQHPADPASVTAGLAYINRCLRGHRPFGVVTAASADTLAPLLDRVANDCALREDLHVVRMAAPSASVADFITKFLAQVGFDLLQAPLEDLTNLVLVFLRHESARGRRTLAIVEDTQNQSPSVLKFMQSLSEVRAGPTPTTTFLLTGLPSLNRVLESSEIVGLQRGTRERFDMDRALAWIARPGEANFPVVNRELRSNAVDSPPLTAAADFAKASNTSSPIGSLVVTLNNAILERRALTPGRLTIGRSSNTDLQLIDRCISRNHAALVVTDDSVIVVDLHSTNHTIVNGQSTSCHQLSDGDVVTIGGFDLRYECSRDRMVPEAGIEPARPITANGF